MKDRGSMTILSLILFTFILVLILSIINISETENLYNHNTNEVLQHKYILESHFNYMMNEDKYIGQIEDILREYISKGKSLSNISFKIDEKLLDSKSSVVDVLYDSNSPNLAIIKMSNSYHGMDKALEIKMGIVNEIFFDNDGYIIYRELDESKKLKVIELLDRIENEGIGKRKNIIVKKDDIVIDEDLDFQGIIVSTQGKIIVEEGKNLNIKGLLISKENPLGSIKIDKDDSIIRKAGVYLPGFFKFKLVYKKMR